ncbi:6-bladed beta-propeller [Bacillaceae bacterium IKA-2]|nr:6-bladed beta-propeller [Bacillaceae bacterium IKA-2]
MNRLTVYIGMVVIVLVNVAVFSFLFNNQSYAISSGIQGFESSTVTFSSHIYGDFDEPLDKPMDVTKTSMFIYTTDAKNNRVNVFDLSGGPLYTFGEPGDEPGQFNFPYGIAGDSEGNVFVADMYNGKISIHDAKGEFIDYFAENTKVIKSPGGLRIKNDLVYVTDIQESKVFVFNLDGELLLEVGENGSEPGQLFAPNAVTADGEGNIYVVDTGNQRVQIFNEAGEFMSMFNGSASEELEATFVNPRGIGIGSNREIYVVSNLTHIVHVFDQDGKELSKFGGMGEGPGELYLPNGLFIDERNTIYITDTINKRISVFN